MATVLGTGRPRTEVNINDLSVVATKQQAGIACVQGYCTKGEPYKAKFIPNWDEFLTEFGDVNSTSDFALLCKRALEAGAKLYVSRVAHWTGSAWDGTKATGTVTEGANNLAISAKFVGSGYNGINIKVSAAKSGDATKVDITETQGRSIVVVTDIPKTGHGASDLLRINNTLRFTTINSLPTTLPIGSVNLASGAQPANTIVDADYNGSNTTETKGWYAFNDVTDSMYIFNFERAVPAVDASLSAYCEMRGDMRFYIRPADADNLDYQKMIDYRMGTGAYSHTPLDTFLGSIIAGSIVISNPLDPTQNKNISAIGDVCGLLCKKDVEFGQWYTTAGPKRGVLKNNNGVPYNLGNAANASFFDRVYDKGINVVIQDPSFGVVYWGNRVLLRDQTKKLRTDSAANLSMHIKRSITPLIRSEQFEPNSPSYWHKIYRKVKPFINDLEAREAIGIGENINWQWQGDQNAKNLNDLQYNKIQDVEAGIYKARFVYVDITVMEYIEIENTITDTNTISEILQS